MPDLHPCARITRRELRESSRQHVYRKLQGHAYPQHGRWRFRTRNKSHRAVVMIDKGLRLAKQDLSGFGRPCSSAIALQQLHAKLPLQ